MQDNEKISMKYNLYYTQSQNLQHIPYIYIQTKRKSQNLC